MPVSPDTVCVELTNPCADGANVEGLFIKAFQSAPTPLFTRGVTILVISRSSLVINDILYGSPQPEYYYMSKYFCNCYLRIRPSCTLVPNNKQHLVPSCANLTCEKGAEPLISAEQLYQPVV